MDVVSSTLQEYRIEEITVKLGEGRKAYLEAIQHFEERGFSHARHFIKGDTRYDVFSKEAILREENTE